MDINSGILRILWFLNYAGICLFRFDANFPLWAPNYPEESQKMRTMVIHSPCSADVGAFKPGQLETRIIDNTLYVSGIAVDIVAGVSDATSAGYFSHGSFAGYIRQRTARYPVYKRGIPFLGFYYIFMAEALVEPNASRIRIMAFLIKKNLQRLCRFKRDFSLRRVSNQSLVGPWRSQIGWSHRR
jgi:hypothetical protein